MLYCTRKEKIKQPNKYIDGKCTDKREIKIKSAAGDIWFYIMQMVVMYVFSDVIMSAEWRRSGGVPPYNCTCYMAFICHSWS